MDRSVTRVLLTGGRMEENQAFKTIIFHYLAPNYQPIVVDDISEALTQFDEHVPDCILLNAEPGDTETLPAIDAFKSKSENSVIILLVHDEQDVDQHALRQAGAASIIVKRNLSAETLRMAIFEARAQLKFNRFATTGHVERHFLPNTEQFMEILAHSLIHSRQRHHLLSLTVCEYTFPKNKLIDKEAFTTALARHFAHVVRQIDIVGFLDNNQIGLIFHDVSKLFDSTLVIERLFTSLDNFHFKDIKNEQLVIKFGVTNFPLDGTHADELVNNSHKALEFINHKKTNSFQHYCETPQHNLDQQTMIHDDLHDAIAKDEFYLVFQPIFNLAEKKIVSAEALIRWQHPLLGNIPPNEFIPYAEQTGLIETIGYWVIEEACRNYNEWHQKGIQLDQIFINISTRQLKSDFISMFHEILSKHQIKPGSIGIELTDIALTHNMQETCCIVKEMRDLGVDVSIDDFGRGFSTMAYFDLLPANAIKIDHVFTHGVPDNPSDLAVVSSVVNLTHNLGIKVIAEGIETAEQFEYLKQLNCEYGQGFYLCKPMKSGTFSEYLQNHSKELQL